ncbi:C4-dicarboxylate ABC transporter permease [Chromatiales bacterium (ex Bugula neritina AB1)]|nr:C4-dicarboxylate ABC transporter permease [Chromatiales bacterium (ex Bugula neritina AB1)]
MTASIIGFSVLLALVLLRVPIAFAMGVVGFAGFGILVSWSAAGAMVAGTAYETGVSYTLSVVPLFVLMGNFVTRAGLSDELYTASHKFLGHKRGGLAMATVVACGGFSAVCGSSIATAATMARVTIPSMRRYNYSDALATGAIASGGTLGILIPPSVVLVLFGVMTETDIGKLFVAGLLPGLLGVLLYLVAVRLTVWINPAAGPPVDKAPWVDRIAALKSTWAVLGLFLLIIGGIYGGIFTPTEAAGIGSAGGFLIALFRGKLNLKVLLEIFVETVQTTAMLFFVLIGAIIFSNFINYADMPTLLIDWISSLNVAPLTVMAVILLIYVLLGCILESLSMILLTVPVFYPLVSELVFPNVPPDMVMIWFGIVVVVVTEISLITPPIGMNVFVLKAMLPDVETKTIFKGVTPFWILDIVRLALLVLVPSISLYLPSLMD